MNPSVVQIALSLNTTIFKRNKRAASTVLMWKLHDLTRFAIKQLPIWISCSNHDIDHPCECVYSTPVKAAAVIEPGPYLSYEFG